MSDPFVAEIRMMGFNFAPTGWAKCNGQLLPISQNTALFSLLGTTYGGDGKSTFALPDLQGATPLQQGQGPGLSLYDLGQESGSSTVTLLVTEMPSHTHPLIAVNDEGLQANPQGSTTARANIYYNQAGSYVDMSQNMVAPSGSSQPHNNMQPYLTVNFCIAMQGIYPPRP
jgi:microcystin-dependent protein